MLFWKYIFSELNCITDKVYFNRNTKSAHVPNGYKKLKRVKAVKNYACNIICFL